jgi:hypothetical protein
VLLEGKFDIKIEFKVVYVLNEELLKNEIRNKMIGK